MSLTEQPAFLASCPRPRSWSSLVIAEKFSGGMLGALWAAIRQLVLQGFPTTTTLAHCRANWLRDFPVLVKIWPFSFIKSPRSWPFERGLEP